MRRMWKTAVAIGVSCVIVLATGCGSSTAKLRLLNAFPIQANVDMLIDGKVVASGITYAAASSYVSVDAGSRRLQLEPSGTNSPFVDQTISVSSGSNSTVVASSNGAVVVSDDNKAPASGNISLRVINASSTLGTADAYIVTSGTGIAGTTPTFSKVTFPSGSGYQTFAAGSYQVIFTLPGQQSAVVSTTSLSFTSGQVRTIVALNGATGGFATAVLTDLN